ncbi:MAG: 6-hydroxymethylpterin diphosphokinase MptE-like protein, partial [Planctomycetota bacterium]
MEPANQNPEQPEHPPASTPNPFDFSDQGGGLAGLEGLGLESLGLGSAASRGLPADPAILEKNLVALCARNRLLAQRIASATPAAGVSFERGPDGAVTGVLEGRRLGSKRRAVGEADALADSVDPAECAAACVVGFGLGHHVAALQRRLGLKSLVVAFEPDVGLLRSVLERVDHSAWLALGRCVIVTDAADTAGLTRCVEGFEGVLALGTRIVEHSPSRARIGEDAVVFGRSVSEVVRATRTNIVTTLAHAPVTLRNMTMNADRYATCAGVNALKGSCVGCPAVTVAAGPSLKKNLAVLGGPGVSDRVVIIAAQTVLKPMLEAGIRPHFVTALDHHELSGRFYEGLTPEDVEGVRLVVEPKANPAILEKFPGEILCTGEPMLDLLIGDGLSRRMDELPAGATVAHLSYFLARYLGCDPVIMIGQDLGFTDHQYYAGGAAIHSVWQGELNNDRTLEMLEWERIARMRANLHRVEGKSGRPVYADEQMVTYQAQFEAEFQKDAQRGLVVIDATEGGTSKRHTKAMALREALDTFADQHVHSLPDTMGGTRGMRDVVDPLRAHWMSIIGQSREIRSLSKKTAASLRRIADRDVDPREANKIVGEVQKIGEHVRSLSPAFKLVEFVNQTGVLNRYKEDRLNGLADESDGVERQSLQAERDISNVEWIGAAASELERQMSVAVEVLDGKRNKLTRDEAAQPDQTGVSDVREPVAAEVFVLCDPSFGGLGQARDLGQEVWRGESALSLTLRRALSISGVRGVRVLTPDPVRTAELVGQAGLLGRAEIERVDPDRWRDRRRAVGRARANAADGWRGGVGHTTVFDEQFCPEIVAEVMDRRRVQACVLIGADWPLVDPLLIDSLIARHAEAPDRHQITFSQAAPGLGACVISREAVGSIIELVSIGSPLGTIGGVLGYVPVRTQADPIGTSLCVPVDAAVRDLGLRMIADSPTGRERVAGVLDCLADRAYSSSAYQSARAVHSHPISAMPRTLVLELCQERKPGAVFGAWKGGGIDRSVRERLTISRASEALQSFATHRPDGMLVLDGPGDPLMHPGVFDFASLGDELGLPCVMLRSDLLADGFDAERLVASGVGVLSVDLLCPDAPTYAALTGVNGHELVMERINSVAGARDT